MGMPVVRLKDLCSGHGCFPPRPTIEASTDVFVNNRGHHRMDDALAVHCCGMNCHPSQTCVGSSTVFVNRKTSGACR